MFPVSNGMRLKSANTYIKLFIGVLFVLLIVMYTYIQFGNFVEGPVITVNSPLNGSTSTDSLITIEGVAKHISHIQVNDNQIFVDENGNFNEKLLLSYGYNIITIEAQDRFDRNVKKTLELVYK